ncbi:hypothetical protein ABPG74_001218 [Tetrahymena malaccensis]
MLTANQEQKDKKYQLLIKQLIQQFSMIQLILIIFICQIFLARAPFTFSEQISEKNSSSLELINQQTQKLLIVKNLRDFLIYFQAQNYQKQPKQTSKQAKQIKYRFKEEVLP